MNPSISLQNFSAFEWTVQWVEAPQPEIPLFAASSLSHRCTSLLPQPGNCGTKWRMRRWAYRFVLFYAWQLVVIGFLWCCEDILSGEERFRKDTKYQFNVMIWDLFIGKKLKCYVFQSIFTLWYCYLCFKEQSFRNVNWVIICSPSCRWKLQYSLKQMKKLKTCLKPTK